MAHASHDPRPRSAHARLAWTLVVLLALLLATPFLLGAAGVVDVSAQGSLAPLEGFLGYARERSVAVHASDRTNPYADDPAAIADALPHFREMCVVCHGAPGIEPGEIGRGVHPEPPDLASRDTQEMSDGELFWIITHGIGLSAMPAFEEADGEEVRWKLAAFVRHLPELTAAERERLREGSEGHHGGGGEHHEEGEEHAGEGAEHR